MERLMEVSDVDFDVFSEVSENVRVREESQD
jgi:hypothetical protein